MVVVSSVEYSPAYSNVNPHALFNKLLNVSWMRGIYIVNNDGIMAVGDGVTALLRGEDLGRFPERWDHANTPDSGRMWTPKFCTGFIKTRPPVWDAPVLPYCLEVDENGLANIDNENLLYLPDAVECYQPSLYKELIAQDADIVYMTSDGPVFRKGVL